MRLYYGGYGHHPSGKQYVYWGSDNFRTGQNVVAPVTNKFSGKTYNTMFTIMRTGSADASMAENEAQRLSQSGIGIKSILGTDTLQLPGGKNFSSKKSWREESNEKFFERARTRLTSTNTQFENTNARTRLIGE